MQLAQALSESTNTSASYYVVKQLIAIGLGLVGFGLSRIFTGRNLAKILKTTNCYIYLPLCIVRFVGQRLMEHIVGFR
jgi:TM2 domain-containing membrane protein YozV